MSSVSHPHPLGPGLKLRLQTPECACVGWGWALVEVWREGTSSLLPLHISRIFYGILMVAGGPTRFGYSDSRPVLRALGKSHPRWPWYPSRTPQKVVTDQP